MPRDAAAPKEAGQPKDAGTPKDGGAQKPPDAGTPPAAPDAGGAQRPDAGGAQRPDAGGAQRPDAGGAQRPDAGGARPTPHDIRVAQPVSYDPRTGGRSAESAVRPAFGPAIATPAGPAAADRAARPGTPVRPGGSAPADRPAGSAAPDRPGGGSDQPRFGQSVRPAEQRPGEPGPEPLREPVSWTPADRTPASGTPADRVPASLPPGADGRPVQLPPEPHEPRDPFENFHPTGLGPDHAAERAAGRAAAIAESNAIMHSLLGGYAYMASKLFTDNPVKQRSFAALVAGLSSFGHRNLELRATRSFNRGQSERPAPRNGRPNR